MLEPLPAAASRRFASLPSRSAVQEAGRLHARRLATTFHTPTARPITAGIATTGPPGVMTKQQADTAKAGLASAG
jgi:hypothetical protein